jgi:hypothetical protein
MSEEQAKPAKAKKTRGPAPMRLKIQGDWKDAVKTSFRKQIVKRNSK